MGKLLELSSQATMTDNCISKLIFDSATFSLLHYLAALKKEITKSNEAPYLKVNQWCRRLNSCLVNVSLSYDDNCVY